MATKGSTSLSYRVAGRRPGRFQVGPVVARSTDPCGLAEAVQRAGDGLELTVLPRIESVDEEVSRSLLARPQAGGHVVNAAGAGSEFYAIREYRPGDPLRAVNWKASARRGRGLFVNQRHHEARATILYLADGSPAAATGTRRTNAWVLAARAVATFAQHDMRRRDKPVLAVSGEPASLREGSFADPLLLELAEPFLRPPPGGPQTLRETMDALLPALRPKSPVVVLSNLLDDDTVEETVLALRAIEAPVTVLSPSGPALLEMAGAPGGQVSDAWIAREALVGALRGAGAKVVDWDPRESLAAAVPKGARL